MLKDFIKPTVVLLLVTLFAAAIIGVTFTVTEEPIMQQRANAEIAAIIALLPTTYETEYLYIDEADSTLTRLTVSLDNNGEVIGYVFSASPSGYSGRINMMVAIDTHGVIKGVKIIRHTETPGLGANITQEWFTGEFAGRTGRLVSAHHPTGSDEIPIIASATVSVNAVLRGVNDAVAFFERGVTR